MKRSRKLSDKLSRTIALCLLVGLGLLTGWYALPWCIPRTGPVPCKWLTGYLPERLATHELPGVGEVRAYQIIAALDHHTYDGLCGAHRPLLAEQLAPLGLTPPPSARETQRWVVLISLGDLEEHPEFPRPYPATIRSERRTVTATFFKGVLRPYAMAFGYHSQLPPDERPLRLEVKPPGLHPLTFDLTTNPPIPYWRGHPLPTAGRKRDTVDRRATGPQPTFSVIATKLSS